MKSLTPLLSKFPEKLLFRNFLPPLLKEVQGIF